MIKASREAKVHSSWIRPNEPYEKALRNFVQVTLSSDTGNAFLREFVPFQKMIAWYGIINSLVQTTLKATTPGIPDFYQGSEIWDFSLVDPDNRRPVDFELRIKLLDEITARENDPTLIEELVSKPQDGRIKMFLIHKLLVFRRRLEILFANGRYVPLLVNGTHQDSVVAFMRNTSESLAIVVVPRMMTKVVKYGQMPFGRGVWGDTAIRVPVELIGRILKNCLTSDTIEVLCETISVGDILTKFPVAVLEG
jgi:(1->4)-alpha-D-glucan 1-alpha-D-glucosylmutase